MDILIGLIIISLCIAVTFLSIFFWNLRNGQYDDTVTPGIRILFDDSIAQEKPEDDLVKTTSDKNQISS